MPAHLARSLRLRLALLGLSSFVLGACASSPVAPALLEKKGRKVERGEVALRWIGTAGFEVRTSTSTAVLDPFLTRPSLPRVLFGRLVPDEEVLARALPRADVVMVGHSHFDHALDAPALAARTGALLLGTATTCHLAERLEPEAHCRRVRGDERLKVGGFTVTPVASEHLKLPLIGVPLDGVVEHAPATREPPHALEMPMGGALVWVLRTEGLTVVHVSSSSLPDDPAWLRHAVPEGADVVLASAAMHERTERYAERIVEELRPRLVIPHHFETFTGQLPEELGAEEREEGEGLAERFRALGVKAHVPAPFEELVVSDASLPPRAAE